MIEAMTFAAMVVGAGFIISLLSIGWAYFCARYIKPTWLSLLVLYLPLAVGLFVVISWAYYVGVVQS